MEHAKNERAVTGEQLGASKRFVGRGNPANATWWAERLGREALQVVLPTQADREPLVRASVEEISALLLGHAVARHAG
jgi:hypothetical protein